jgi:hypothetical protein
MLELFIASTLACPGNSCTVRTSYPDSIVCVAKK